MYKNWVFTGWVEDLSDLLEIEKECHYVIAGLEAAPTTGEWHWQGYFQLKKPQRLTYLKALVHPVSDSMHFEPAKGSPSDNTFYCSKDPAILLEWGSPVTQGSRVDVRAFVADSKVTDRRTMYEVHPDCMVRYGRAYDDVRRTFAEPTQGARLYWLFGPSGTGKTTFVQAKHPDLYKKDPTHQWWQGYNGQSTILIDEITEHIPYSTLLTLCDAGVNRLQTKGGDTASQATRIYITSNDAPDRVYAQDAARADRWSALLRRCLFLRVERVSHGRSVMKQVEWTSQGVGWVETGDERQFAVDIKDDGPRMSDLD